ncbi:cyclic nucleotide-gated channel beta-1-like [Chelonoidis abingdonii]|uniref:cyclic nucleotide-gated channel beta-1-like n=1 Tax=Chelonoidis abingdonii TaxID=106734 RepID=UPI003F496CA8
MLGWIERMLPHPPGTPHQPPLVENGDRKADPRVTTVTPRSGEAEQLPKGNSTCPGKSSNSGQTEGAGKKVTFITTQEPGPSSVSSAESAGRGVLSWLSQELGKVVPQPAQNPGMRQTIRKSFENSLDFPDQTEVQSIKDDDDLLEITTLAPDEDELQDHSELHSSSDNNASEKGTGSRVISWLMQGFGKMIPQPENLNKLEDVAEGKVEEAAVREVCILPEGQVGLVMEELDTNWDNEAGEEVMHWDNKAELTVYAPPSHSRREEIQEEEKRLHSSCSQKGNEEEERKIEGSLPHSPCIAYSGELDECAFAAAGLGFEQLEEDQGGAPKDPLLQVEEEEAGAARTDAEASDALSFA